MILLLPAMVKPPPPTTELGSVTLVEDIMVQPLKVTVPVPRAVLLSRETVPAFKATGPVTPLLVPVRDMVPVLPVKLRAVAAPVRLPESTRVDVAWVSFKVLVAGIVMF